MTHPRELEKHEEKKKYSVFYLLLHTQLCDFLKEVIYRRLETTPLKWAERIHMMGLRGAPAGECYVATQTCNFSSQFKSRAAIFTFMNTKTLFAK